jgi:hypothetical protein
MGGPSCVTLATSRTHPDQVREDGDPRRAVVLVSTEMLRPVWLMNPLLSPSPLA